jgi:serine/threonine protein kinase
MAFLHSKKIMHRDLKSKNLLVDANWKIKRTHTTNQLTTIVAITTTTTIAAVISLSTRKRTHTYTFALRSFPPFFPPVCDFGFARTYMKGKRPYTLCGTEDWMVRLSHNQITKKEKINK